MHLELLHTGNQFSRIPHPIYYSKDTRRDETSRENRNEEQQHGKVRSLDVLKRSVDSIITQKDKHAKVFISLPMAILCHEQFGAPHNFHVGPVITRGRDLKHGVVLRIIVSSTRT